MSSNRLIRNIIRNILRPVLIDSGSGAAPGALLHAIIYGQSLSVGYAVSGAGAVVSDPNSAHRMFNGGVRPHYDTPGLVNEDWVMEGSQVASLANLAEAINPNDAGHGETFASGMALQFGDSRRFLFSCTGRDAFTVGDLGRLPSVPARASHFINTIGTIIQGQELAASLGMTYSIPFIVFKQGTSDALNSNTRSAWKSSVTQLLADLRNHIEVATELDASSIPMVVDQVGWNVAGRTFGEIATGAIDLHRETGGDIICAGPNYYADYVGGDPHFTSVGYRNYGEKLGEVCAEPASWQPCYITGVSRAGTTITVSVNVPVAPLVTDTTLVASVSGSGFAYTGGTVNSVTITNDGAATGMGTIELAVSADAPGTLRYAYENGTGSWAGATLGPRGNIRDSSPLVSQYNSKPLPNWLCVDSWSVA